MAVGNPFQSFSGGYNPSFPNPFIDVASMNMPQSLRNALLWAEFIVSLNGTYRAAMERVISYFMTDIEFGDTDADDEEKEKSLELMRDTLNIFGALLESFRNRLTYGNDFTSLLVPFQRYLTCPKCHSSYPLRVVYDNFNFSWSDMQFTATCPHCKVGSGYHGQFIVTDRPDDLERKISIKHWNPHEIEILHDYYSDRTAYLWRIPEDYKQQIRKGHLWHLENVPMPVMDAIKKNQMFRFNDGVIYHMKEQTLAGIRNRGWGIPRVITNFRQVYYVQVLRRFNEAIALDYVVPFRLLTPAPRPGGGGGGAAGQMADPMMAFNMSDFKSSAMSMLRKHRHDPSSWHVLPFPVQFQMLGGDAAKLAPVELIANGEESLLNAAGVPVELYKGSLQMQTAPPALRVFEAMWQPLVHDGNGWLRWVARQFSQLLNWTLVKPMLKRVTIADDIQKQMMMMQMFMGNQVSGSDALKTIGLDWKQQQRRMGEEAMYQAEQQARISEEMDQAGFAQQMAKGNVVPGAGGAPGQSGGAQQAGGQAAGGGQGQAGGAGPMQGPVDQFLANMGPNTPVSPQDLMQAADTIANGLMGMPDATKDSQLRLLKQKNPTLHAVVRSKIDELRKNARNAGGQQVLNQQFPKH